MADDRHEGMTGCSTESGGCLVRVLTQTGMGTGHHHIEERQNLIVVVE